MQTVCSRIPKTGPSGGANPAYTRMYRGTVLDVAGKAEFVRYQLRRLTLKRVAALTSSEVVSGDLCGMVLRIHGSWHDDHSHGLPVFTPTCQIIASFRTYLVVVFGVCVSVRK